MVSTHWPNEETHCQLKPNVEITLPSEKNEGTHNPPLHISTEVNKKMTQMEMEKRITEKMAFSVIII